MRISTADKRDQRMLVRALLKKGCGNDEIARVVKCDTVTVRAERRMEAVGNLGPGGDTPRGRVIAALAFGPCAKATLMGIAGLGRVHGAALLCDLVSDGCATLAQHGSRWIYSAADPERTKVKQPESAYGPGGDAVEMALIELIRAIRAERKERNQ